MESAWSLWLSYLLLALILVGGLVLVAATLPGLWIMVGAAAIYAWATNWQYIGLWTIILLLVLGMLSEAVEFVAGGAGAKQAGGSSRAAWGAILGSLIGAIFLSLIPIPIISTIVGACLGAFIGALLAEFTVHGRADHSMRVGWGAAKGRFWGILAKLAFGVAVMAIVLVMAAPVPWRKAPPPATQPATQPSTALS